MCYPSRIPGHGEWVPKPTQGEDSMHVIALGTSHTSISKLPSNHSHLRLLLI